MAIQKEPLTNLDVAQVLRNIVRDRFNEEPATPVIQVSLSEIQAALRKATIGIFQKIRREGIQRTEKFWQVATLARLISETDDPVAFLNHINDERTQLGLLAVVETLENVPENYVEEIFSRITLPILEDQSLTINPHNLLHDDVLADIGDAADHVSLRDTRTEEQLKKKLKDIMRELQYAFLLLNTVFARAFPNIKNQTNKNRYCIVQEHIIDLLESGMEIEEIITHTTHEIQAGDHYATALNHISDTYTKLMQLRSDIDQVRDKFSLEEARQIDALFDAIFVAFPLVEQESKRY